MSQVLIPLLIVILNPCIGQHSYNFALTTASKLKDAQSHEQSNYTRPSVFNQNICCRHVKIGLKTYLVVIIF